MARGVALAFWYALTTWSVIHCSFWIVRSRSSLTCFASVIQFETDEDARTAELVITTHHATGAALEAALAEIRALDVIVEVGNVLAMAG